MAETRRNTPISARLESFGAQGGIDSAGIEHKATPWNYSQRPQSGRYPCGTAAGGFILTPPQVQSFDLTSAVVSGGVIQKYPPEGISPSETYLLSSSVHSFIGWGLPEIATGTMRHGYRSWATAAGELAFDCVGPTGAITRALTMRGNCDGIEIENLVKPRRETNIDDIDSVPASAPRPGGEVAPSVASAGKSGDFLTLDFKANKTTAIQMQPTLQPDWSNQNILWRIYYTVSANPTPRDTMTLYLGYAARECNVAETTSVTPTFLTKVLTQGNPSDFIPQAGEIACAEFIIPKAAAEEGDELYITLWRSRTSVYAGTFQLLGQRVVVGDLT